MIQHLYISLNHLVRPHAISPEKMLGGETWLVPFNCLNSAWYFVVHTDPLITFCFYYFIRVVHSAALDICNMYMAYSSYISTKNIPQSLCRNKKNVKQNPSTATVDGTNPKNLGCFKNLAKMGWPQLPFLQLVSSRRSHQPSVSHP